MIVATEILVLYNSEDMMGRLEKDQFGGQELNCHWLLVKGVGNIWEECIVTQDATHTCTGSADIPWAKKYTSRRSCVRVEDER